MKSFIKGVTSVIYLSAFIACFISAMVLGRSNAKKKVNDTRHEVKASDYDSQDLIFSKLITY